MKLNSIYGNPLACYRCDFPDQDNIVVLTVTMVHQADNNFSYFYFREESGGGANHIKSIKGTTYDFLTSSNANLVYACNTSPLIGIRADFLTPSTGNYSQNIIIECNPGYTDHVIKSFANNVNINITAVVSAGKNIQTVFGRTCNVLYQR